MTNAPSSLLLARIASLLLLVPPAALSLSTLAPPKPTAVAKPTTAAPARMSDQIILTWEPEAANDIREKATIQCQNSNRPYVVGIVGIPGSGKTTGAHVVQELLGDDCVVIPMDGYHYSRAKLRSLFSEKDPDDALYRRGAPDTFDAASFARDLARLRVPNNAAPCWFPGFDHGVADPQPDQYCFNAPQHQICIAEGLYLLHDQDGWEALANGDLFDYTIFVDANVDTCMDRLKVRNQKIPGYTAEEIAVRVDAVDRVNAMTVLATKPRADRVVMAPSFAPKVGV